MNDQLVGDLKSTMNLAFGRGCNYKASSFHKVLTQAPEKFKLSLKNIHSNSKYIPFCIKL